MVNLLEKEAGSGMGDCNGVARRSDLGLQPGCARYAGLLLQCSQCAKCFHEGIYDIIVMLLFLGYFMDLLIWAGCIDAVPHQAHGRYECPGCAQELGRVMAKALARCQRHMDSAGPDLDCGDCMNSHNELPPSTTGDLGEPRRYRSPTKKNNVVAGDHGLRLNLGDVGG